MVDYTLVGRRIKRYRAELNMTQEWLAKKLEVSTPYVSRIECGKAEPNLEMLTRISNIMGISITKFLEDANTSSSDYLIEEFKEILSDCTPKQRQYYLSILENVKYLSGNIDK